MYQRAANPSAILSRWSRQSADLLEETPPILKGGNERLDSPMYGVFRTPAANNVDLSSPLGNAIYAEAIEEMKDLDIAYSRNAGEIYDSEKIILADDRLMFDSGKNLNGRIPDVKLPHYVKKRVRQQPEEFIRRFHRSLTQPHAWTESRSTPVLRRRSRN